MQPLLRILVAPNDDIAKVEIPRCARDFGKDAAVVYYLSR
jgi:hypothetical protein